MNHRRNSLIIGLLAPLMTFGASNVIGYAAPGAAPAAANSTPSSPAATPAPAAMAQDNVTITDKGTHYEVVFDLENGANHRQIGEEYGRKLRTQVPAFERELDSYLTEHRSSWLVDKVLTARVNQIKPQIPQAYRDEIEGMASQLSGGSTDVFGDGKISLNELYLFNLLGDVARVNQCSAVAVYGNSSATGSSIVGRNFDWPDGKKNQLAQIQSVLTIKDGKRSTVNVACLGFQGAISALNRNGVFAAVLDSPTGAKYSAKEKHSYLLDLREALENGTTLLTVAEAMRDSRKKFAFNHSIMIADKQGAAVLENNVSNTEHGGKDGIGKRSLRTADSELQPGVLWGIPDAVGCVNCFELAETEENSVDPADREAVKKSLNATIAQVNLYRWQSMKGQLIQHGPQVSVDGMKAIMSFYHPESGGDMYKGDLYNRLTLQNIVFEPATLTLSSAFRPKDGSMPPKPIFESIPVKFSAPRVQPQQHQ